MRRGFILQDQDQDQATATVAGLRRDGAVCELKGEREGRKDETYRWAETATITSLIAASRMSL